MIEMATSLNRWRAALVITCITILFLLATITVLLILRFPNKLNDRNTSSSSTEVCITRECISATVLLLKNMDFEADPCQDFFQFSCGGYVKRTVFRPDTIKFGIDKFREVADELQHILFELLALPADSDNLVTPSLNDSTHFNQSVMQLPQKFFQSCMEYKSSEENRISALQLVLWKDIADAINTTLKKEIRSNTTLAKQLVTALMAAQTLNENSLINIQILSETFYDGIFNENFLVIDRGPLMFSFNESLNISKVEQFFTEILGPKFKVFDVKLLQSNESSQTHWKNMVQRLVTLFEEFQSVENSTCRYSPDIKPIKVTLNQLINYQQFAKDDNDTLRSLGDALDWPKYFKKIFHNTNISLEKEIVFKYPLCLSKMLMVVQKSLLSSINQNEQPPVSAIFFNINSLAYFSKLLPKGYQELFRESEIFYLDFSMNVFMSQSMGKSANDDQKQCVSAVMNNLEPLVIWLYAEKHFKFGRTPVLKLSEEINNAFKTNVNLAQWLSAESKQRIIAKVDDIRQVTAFPDFTIEDLQQLYVPVLKQLQNNDDGLHDKFGFLFAMTLKSKTRVSLDLIFKNIVSVFTVLTPLQVNAFNMQLYNAIVFPVGILRPPVFHPEYPDYVNYAIAGFIIGHEIGHSFDNTGHEISKNAERKHFWDNITEVEYLKRQSCFQEAYSKYELAPGVPLDGNSTVGNNIADAMGMRAALTAWQLAGYPGPRLLGRLSEFSAQQLFFIFSSQLYCERKTRRQYLARYKNGPSHSPGKFRVIGTVSNNEDFAKTFNCPRFSPMNPENKCILW